MQSDATVTFNWFRVNLPTIVCIATLGLWIVNANHEQKNRLDQMEQFRVIRTKETDGNFAAVKNAVDILGAKIEPLNNLQYRTQQLEMQQLELNKRLDRIMENLTGSLEMIRKDVGSLSTKVEVLSGKIDRLRDEPNPSPTSFRRGP